MNYGLRYEYYSPLRERGDAQVLFDINTGTLRDPKQAPYKSSKNNFGPRVAIAWSPNATGAGDEKTLLRRQARESLALLQSADVHWLLPRRCTSGYLLPAPPAQT